MISILWIPVIFALAMVMIIVGMLLIFISALSARDKEIEKRTEAGGIIILGPIPIAFGTSKKIVKSLLIISIIFFIVVLTIFVLLNSGLLFPRY